MGRYLLIDTESKSLKMLQEAILSFDGSAQFFSYDSLDHLNQHRSSLSKSDDSLFLNFNLAIISVPHPLPPKWYTELQTFTEQFNIANPIAPASSSPSPAGTNQKHEQHQIVLTGHELLPAHNKLIRNLKVYNFIFKPFDETLLKEQLNLACHNEEKTRSLELKSQEAGALIAFLKEVELQSLSEIGFMTLSEVQIPIKSISKYFSPLFMHGKKQSAWAQCLVSLAHPTKPNTFINKFQFIYSEHGLLQALRRYLKNHHQDQISSSVWNFSPKSAAAIKKLNLGIFCKDNDESILIKSDLETQFENINIEIVVLNEDAKKNNKYHHLDVILNYTDSNVELLKLYFSSQTQYILFTENQNIDENELKELSSSYLDLFILPLDKSYFHKKLKLHFAYLEFREEVLLSHVTCHEKIKAATTIKMTDISEVMVNLNYGRQLDMRSFRDFVFISQDETQSVELPAFCHFSDPHAQTSPDNHKEYFHQFVFFAVNEHHLKQIRLWLLQNYIEHNEKKG